jgi:hypothetical protein
MDIVANKQRYKDYIIEKSGFNYYVTDPSGHRAFGEVPASVEVAKKWIDQDVREKGRKAAFPMRMVEKAAGFDAAFDGFLAHSQKTLTDYMTSQFPTLPFAALKAYEGGRYVKIVKEEGSSSRSAWGFVDKTNGDVLKAAGWGVPAKGARANVFDRGSWRNVGAYGPAYMRDMRGAEVAMDKNAVAEELVKIAKGLTATVLPETRAMVEKALPDLERHLKPILGFAPRLSETGSGSDWVKFEDEIGGSAMGVFAAVFKRATVKVVVTMKPLSDGSYFTDVDLAWESHRGGTNGQDVVTAWFYPDKGTWLVEARR